MVGSTVCRPPVRNDEAGRFVHLRDTLPQILLGLHVQCAGHVVEHQELGNTHEHAGCTGPLYLPARELDAARSDHGFEPGLQLLDVSLYHRCSDRAVEVDLRLDQAQQDVGAELLAEQPRHL